MDFRNVTFEQTSKDIDCYNFEYAPFSVYREVTIWIDFKNKKLWGDIVTSSGWIIIRELEDVKDIRVVLLKSGKLKRDFKTFMKNIDVD